jgi:hypothetical protein
MLYLQESPHQHPIGEMNGNGNSQKILDPMQLGA